MMIYHQHTIFQVYMQYTTILNTPKLNAINNIEIPDQSITLKLSPQISNLNMIGIFTKLIYIWITGSGLSI